MVVISFDAGTMQSAGRKPVDAEGLRACWVRVNRFDEKAPRAVEPRQTAGCPGDGILKHIVASTGGTTVVSDRLALGEEMVSRKRKVNNTT